jgi:hypothetical protein
VARGRHFALLPEDERKLRECEASFRAEWIGNEVEERYVEPWFCDTDKAWDAIHRALSDSTLSYDVSTPLRGVILGGEPLYFKDDYMISYKPASFVDHISAALKNIDKQTFRSLYFKIDPNLYGFILTEHDFEYSWEWLKGLPAFYSNAAKNGLPVIFTA